MISTILSIVTSSMRLVVVSGVEVKSESLNASTLTTHVDNTRKLRCCSVFRLPYTLISGLSVCLITNSLCLLFKVFPMDMSMKILSLCELFHLLLKILYHYDWMLLHSTSTAAAAAGIRFICLMIINQYLIAGCRRWDGRISKSSIDLDSILGHRDGKFIWGGRGFTSSAQDISLHGFQLVAELPHQGGWVLAEVDLSEHIRYRNGTLESFDVSRNPP